MTLETTFAWSAGWTWYRVIGELTGDLTPLVIVHGGPGAAHDYLESLAEIHAHTGRACVLYDQIGCGRSEHRPDAPPEFWSTALFRDELTALLEHLGLTGAFHLLGQSWGGMLGMEYAIRVRPAGLRSLIVADSPASMTLWVAEADRLRADLPEDVRATLERHEAAGTTDSPEYVAATLVFYERHLCRVVPMPESFARSFEQIDADPTVYHTMNGPNEFHVVGHLRDWDITDRLGEITVPTLLISGEHDEATPAVVRPIAERIPGARWELIDGASHSPHLETPEVFFGLVEAFLAEHD